MARLQREKDALLRLELPSDNDVIRRAEIFMMRSGWNNLELAASIGYSRVSLGLFLSGRYDEHHKREGNTLAIRAALVRFLDEHQMDDAERIPTRLYDNNSVRELRRAFFTAIDKGAAYLIDGAPGTGKSCVAAQLLDELRQIEQGKPKAQRRIACYAYCREEETPLALLRSLAIELNVSPRGSIDQVVRKIQYELRGRRSVIVLDEAQHLPRTTIESIRELLDRPPYIGVLLMGSHSLQDRFKDLRMEQWRRRLNKTIVLKGLSRDEAQEIIAGELGAIAPKKAEYLIESAISADYRRVVPAIKRQGEWTPTLPFVKHANGRAFEAYISAGELCKAISLIKEQRALPASEGGAMREAVNDY